MNDYIGPRDENGLILGDLDYPGSLPVVVMRNVIPFLFPCKSCAILSLHVLGRQRYGLTIRIPFTRQPIASSGIGWLAICNYCSEVNVNFSKQEVQKLENKIIPLSMMQVYSVCDFPIMPYVKGFCDKLFQTELPPGVVHFMEETTQKIKMLVPPGAYSQKFARECIEQYQPEVN